MEEVVAKNPHLNTGKYISNFLNLIAKYLINVNQTLYMKLAVVTYLKGLLANTLILDYMYNDLKKHAFQRQF